MSATNGKRLRDAARAVITANRLRDGAVVWRGPGGDWQLHFRNAVLLPVDAAEAALAEARKDEGLRIVVGTYITPVNDGADGPEPAGWKERIRAFGPTLPAGTGGLHGLR